jgi:ATP-dependent DNA ligase
VLNKRFPKVVEALSSLGGDFVLDGELVALDSHGRPACRPKDPLRLSPLLRAPSRQVLEAVRRLGLEGVVGKRIDSTYEPGERSGAWIK